MAHINKKGNLSGALGEIVFVNDGDRKYTRLRPDLVRQSERTKAASKVFGMVSSREKKFRTKLLNRLQMPAIQYLAAQHRGRLQKCITGGANSAQQEEPQFGNPEALIGFEFNRKLKWHERTNFFPFFKETANGALKVSLPAIKWGREIKTRPKATSAVLTLTAVSVNLNSTDVPLKIVSTLTMEVGRSSESPAQEWTVPADDAPGWLLIIGMVQYSGNGLSEKRSETFSATYLWTGIKRV